MVVVSYEWYKTTYGGGLDEDTFNRLASQAFLFADAMTEYRLSACWARLAEPVRTAVMSAVCAYADQANIEESGGPVSSETNDGISRTYVTGSASSAGASSAGASKNAGTAQGRLSNAIRLYLAPTGLLFRGRGRR